MPHLDARLGVLRRLIAKGDPGQLPLAERAIDEYWEATTPGARKRSPFGTGNGPWITYETLTYFSDSTIGSIGACPFKKGTASEPATLSEITTGSIASTEMAEEFEDHGCPCV
jgi:hypothetical protein